MKAIETEYNGYRFRSRTEARWAVFFDALGVAYQYEVEGFDLGEFGWYLPDFYLPNFPNPFWLEVKGKRPTDEEISKCLALSAYTGQSSAIFWGQVGPPVIDVRVSKKDLKWKLHDGAVGLFVGANQGGNRAAIPSMLDPNIYAWSTHGDDVSSLDTWPVYLVEHDNDDPVINAMGTGVENLIKQATQYQTYVSLNFPQGYGFRGYFGPGREYFSLPLMKAYKRARSARFEHGETP